MAARVLVILLLSLASAFAEPLSRIRTMQVIKEVKQKGAYFGIIAAYPPEEIAFFASKAFEPDPNHPFVELSGVHLLYINKMSFYYYKIMFILV